MAAVLEKKAPADKHGSRVDEQIAEATSRIRFHDLSFGGLLLAAMVLAYATAMMLLDKSLVLPEWVRQVSLLGFLAALGGVAYATVVLPLRRRVNPLYAAVRVEKTIEDAKNSVVGYVEAKEKENVHPTVKAAMGARAAKSVVQADVNRAVDHRSLVYAGAVAVAFLLALVVLFFVFRPTQFSSLVGRTFAPFTSDPIASQTKIELIEPAGGDVTVTAGQSVSVKVHVVGRVPAADKPDRVRVLLRHNPAAAEYEELALEPGESSRDWQVQVRPDLVRNGVWYKVAGGDYESPEYKVSVRSAPLFTDFEVSYEHPAYVRRPAETARSPHLEGYRGTKVGIVARTNRTVKDGRAVFTPGDAEPVAGKPVPGRPDCLKLEFMLAAPGSYKLSFTSAEGERNADTQSYGVRILEDAAPVVEIVKPEDEEIPLPANGQLAVDAAVGDDLGVDKVTLRMRVVEPTPRPLTDRPYLGGKSFRRESDDTWPRSLDYKDSVDLAKLTASDGQPVELAEGMVIEYWLEAADNRTKPGANGPEPDPNVGKSQVKRVRVTPPQKEPEQEQRLDNQKQQRRNEEQKHNQQQQKKLDNENRDPKAANEQKNSTEPPMADTQPKPPEGMNAAEQPNPQDRKNPKNDANPMPPMNPPKGVDGMDNPMPPANDQANPMPKSADPKADDPMPGGMPMNGMNGAQPNPPPEAPMPNDPNRDKVREQANRVQDKLNRDQTGGGQTKENPAANEGERTPPADAKNQPPMAGGMPPDAPPKPEPKDQNGMAGGAEQAGEPKTEGNAQKPQEPSEPKPDPAGGNPMGPKGGEQPPAESKSTAPKNDTPAGNPGTDKEAPKPEPNDANPPMPGSENQPKPDQNQEKQGGGKCKAASQKSDKGSQGSPSNDPNGMNQPNPAGAGQQNDPAGGAAQSKPKPGNEPGTEKAPPTDPKGGNEPNAAPQSEQGGDPKPQQAPQSGTPKPGPKPDGDPTAGGGMAESKPAPQDGAGNPMEPKGGAGEPKPEGKQPPTGGAGNPDPKAVDKGVEKSNPPAKGGAGEPRQGQPEPKANNGERQPNGDGGKPPELTPEQKKELEKAFNDLTSPKAADRKAAREKLDQTFGKEARKEIEDIANGLNSDDPDERKRAEKKVEELKRQAEEMAKKNGQQPTDPPPAGGNDPKAGPGAKPDPKAVEDLGNPDPKKQQDARDNLDKTVGPDARKQIEKEAAQLQKDLNSDNKQTREAAQKKLEDLKRRADEMARNNPPQNGKGPNDPPAGGPKVDPKEVDKALEDLNSKDEKTRDAAKKKLDEALGKGEGQRAEDLTKDANSGEFNKEGSARKQLEEMRQKAEQKARRSSPELKGKEPSQEEIDDLASKAKDLNSEDEGKRKAAEDALDKKIGKQNREKLQEEMKNQPADDAQKAEEMRKKLEEMAKNGGRGGDEVDPRKTPRGPGGSDPKVNPPIAEDARNRARSAELQLEQFEKNRNNKELHKELGWNESEYEDFLKQFRDEVARLKQDADTAEKAEVPPPAPPSPPVNVGDGAKVEQGPKAGNSGAGVGGPVFAPPGFEKAADAFRKGASKLPAKKP